jgi:homoserine kinase type II
VATFTAIDPRELQTRLKEAGILASNGSDDASHGSAMRLRGVPAGSVNSNYRLEVGPAADSRAARRYFVRLYEEQDRAGAEREARLLRYLSAHGVATPAPISWSSSDHDAVITTLSERPAALFSWVEGDMRCTRGVTVECARSVGVALARVHHVGAELGVADYGEGRFRPSDLRLRLPRIAAAADATLAAQAPLLAARLAAAEARRDPALPRGLVHGDLFRDNVLWAPDGRIAALLDFESASDGVHAYDLAVTILAWTFGDGFDDTLATAMVRGYESVRRLTAAEREGFLAEAILAALRFTVTRITDYAMPRGAADDSRVHKDWRRFDARARWLESLVQKGTTLTWLL